MGSEQGRPIWPKETDAEKSPISEFGHDDETRFDYFKTLISVADKIDNDMREGQVITWPHTDSEGNTTQVPIPVDLSSRIRSYAFTMYSKFTVEERSAANDYIVSISGKKR